jgi:EAL domain-containing protein (putative c-di-GMP-specific phosphodiesterase class I)
MKSRKAMPRSGSTPRADTPEPRDRFLAFAFAAADLLVETDQQARITFAAGAFRHHLGEAPEFFIGCPVESLIATEERAALGLAMRLLAARGRLPPTAIRLNDPGRTIFALAGLAPSGPQGRLCLTLGPLPAPPQEASLAGEAAFSRVVAGMIGDAAETGAVALIDLPGQTRAAVARRPGLEEELDAAILAGAGGRLAGRLAAGRYGLLLPGERADLSGLAARMEEVLLSHGLPGGVTTKNVALDMGALTPAQATRALRHALARFATGGVAGLAEGGLTAALRQIASEAAGVGRAITQRRFELLYQPIVDLRERRPHHYEALLRPAGYGVEAFIRCAETVGLTEELDLAVADQVLDALRFAPGARIALNISGLSIQSPRFRDALVARLDALSGISRRLLVELTESVEVEDETEAHKTLDMLRARGVSICIDDFGAGAAAFRYLRNFPVDLVKVDGTYVQNAVRTERDRSFVASMVDLSLAVGAKVIAEKVETEEHATVMAGLGVELGQGYLFARPGRLPEGAAGAPLRRAG